MQLSVWPCNRSEGYQPSGQSASIGRRAHPDGGTAVARQADPTPSQREDLGVCSLGAGGCAHPRGAHPPLPCPRSSYTFYGTTEQTITPSPNTYYYFKARRCSVAGAPRAAAAGRAAQREGSGHGGTVLAGRLPCVRLQPVGRRPGRLAACTLLSLAVLGVRCRRRTWVPSCS